MPSRSYQQNVIIEALGAAERRSYDVTKPESSIAAVLGRTCIVTSEVQAFFVIPNCRKAVIPIRPFFHAIHTLKTVGYTYGCRTRLIRSRRFHIPNRCTSDPSTYSRATDCHRFSESCWRNWRLWDRIRYWSHTNRRQRITNIKSVSVLKSSRTQPRPAVPKIRKIWR